MTLPTEVKRLVDSGEPTVEERTPRLAHRALELSMQRRLEVDGAGTTLCVRSPRGEVELRVCITAEGPVLRFAAASLEIAQTKALTVDVETLSLRARDVSIAASRDLTQTVAGDASMYCEGRQRIEAGSLSAVSHHGELTLDSTHDLAIRGERVLINC